MSPSRTAEPLLRVALLAAALLAGAAAGARAEDDPMETLNATLTSAQLEKLGSFEVAPERLKALVDRKAGLASVRLGVGTFQHLYATKVMAGDVEVDDSIGSGYDFAEEVLAGALSTGLFAPSQLGLSNSPENERWDYVIGSKWIGSSRKGGVKFFLLKKGRPAATEESLPMPVQWDLVTDHMGRTKGGTPADREQVMGRLGRLLAVRVAEDALGETP